MKWLAVIYDNHCGLCSGLRTWLARQPVFVPFRLVPLHAPGLSLRFPGIEAFRPEDNLVVVSDTGVVWRGDNAWIMILWALREGREFACRVASPALRPLAKKIVDSVSQNRLRWSRWLHVKPDVPATVPSCEAATCRTFR